MIVECTHCKAHVDAVEIGEFGYQGSENYEPGRYVLLKCNRCSNPILVNQELNADEEGDHLSALSVIYPQPELRVNPKAPFSIRAALQEGIACYHARAFTAAAIMCRKTLEGVCKEHGIEERSLHKSLEKMLSTDLIDQRLFEWSDGLRLAGNKAAHGVEVAFSGQDARDSIDFTIGIIDYLFSYRDQFKKFKERQVKRGGGI